ncbi:DUF1015 domain-containing protein [Limnochorda sp.]|uniref:DUF1015 domain-containing protein n=1 Tax=Limnochorda sp. TaxID=1940279 RepID=UPI00182E3AA1|nr:DUF1015 domain-containing protein [Bacillota bacterium]
MPHVRPFRAVRYDPERAGPLEAVLAPPYDVIDPDLQDRLYRRSPQNIVRLVLGRTFPGDGPTNNQYTRAAALYRRWRQAGILRLEAEPALYLYAQRYQVGDGERLTWGWVVAAQVEALGAGRFLPHEATLPGPKADRLALWSETRAIFSQVFGLYHAPDEAERALAFRLMAGEPLERSVDDDGVEHQVWVLPAGPDQARLIAALAPQTVVLADGHHRFETALALAQGPLGRLPGAGRVPMWLVNTALAPVTVLPTHRVLLAAEGLPSWDELLRLAQDAFQVERLPGSPEPQGGGAGEPADAQTVHLLGPDGTAWRLRPRAQASGDLAVVALHRELLDPILQRAGGSQAAGAERWLRFTHQAGEARRWLAEGRGVAAFLLPALEGEAVRQAAVTVGRLPQKSTYFYPKAPSGLLIYDLEESLG